MRSLFAVLAVLALVLTGCASRAGKAPETAGGLKSAEMTVMSYNLRFAARTGENAWPVRRPVMKKSIRLVDPDLIGTQEGVYYQLRELASDLPEYAWIGTGRDGGSRGEFMAVFYKKDRFEPLEFDHFWLSDTPNVVGSTTWGHSNRRMVTWVRFRDLRSGQEFYFWNTHLDHQVQPAREKAAALIRQRVEGLKTTLPVLLVGDFNAAARNNKAYDILVGDGLFTDTRFAAAEQRGEDVGTFNSFKGPTPKGEHIDWILARGDITTDAFQVITYNENGQYPSDHFPIVAWVKVGKPKP